MWSTFLLQLKITAMRKSAIFWVLAFPIILATLFYFMFAGLSNAYSLDPQPVAVVQDSTWKGVQGADALVSGLQSGSGSGNKLIAATNVSGTTQAVEALKTGKAIGYLYAKNSGDLALAVSDTAANSNNNGQQLTISALNNVLRQFNETGSLVTALSHSDPQAFADHNFTGSIGKTDAFTNEITLTHFKPDVSARYHFALLGMACLMAMSLAITAVAESQANLSALGARRTVAPLAKIKLLLAGFLSAWLAVFVCMAVAFIVIRYVFQVSVGGREVAAFAGIAVATFMSSALGTLIGAIPRLSVGVKLGICIGISTITALFSGLYGAPAMKLGDYIQRNFPVLSQINPARQVSTLFYDMLYYDSYQPFFRTVAVLITMSAVFLAAATVLLRRQQYEHL